MFGLFFFSSFFKGAWKFLTSRWVMTMLVLLIIFFSPIIYIQLVGRGKIYTDISKIEEDTYEHAVVFGASITPTGQLSGVLDDRVELASELYKSDLVNKIVVSGHTDEVSYDEPEAMESRLVTSGVDRDDIVVDRSGDRTYFTCYNAKNNLGIDKAILVTQGYHLPRAIFLCDQMGIESTGLSSTEGAYDNFWQYKVREIIATWWAILDILILRPETQTEVKL